MPIADQFAGPVREPEPCSPPKDPEVRFSRPDSSKLLVRRSRYPDAAVPRTCLRLSQLADEDVPRICRAIIGSARKEPGTVVFGARELNGDRDEWQEFLLAAGFAQEDIFTLLLWV